MLVQLKGAVLLLAAASHYPMIVVPISRMGVLRKSTIMQIRLKNQKGSLSLIPHRCQPCQQPRFQLHTRTMLVIARSVSVLAVRNGQVQQPCSILIHAKELVAVIVLAKHANEGGGTTNSKSHNIANTRQYNIFSGHDRTISKVRPVASRV